MGKKIVILGAGLAGLSCAYHLKKKYDIYEKEFEPGGLCRSIKKEGFTFDYAGHLLHFKTAYVFKLVKALLNKNLSSHARNSWVFSNNTYIPYPFQANIHSLDKDAIKDCLVSLVSNKGKQKRPKNFHDWMIHKLGQGVVKHFMFPYNHKFWKLHPKNLSCDWFADRIPIPSLQESVTGAFEKSNRIWGYNWQFWYPKKGGIAVLPKAFERKINKISYGYSAKRVDLKNKIVIFDNSSYVKFDNLVSSIPLPELEKIVYPIPEKVKNAMRRLRYLSILNLNLGVSRNHFDKHWIYFPDKNISFYRLGFFSNFSSNSAPCGKTSLYVESSYLNSQHKTNKSVLIKRMKADLIKVNAIQRIDQVINDSINDIKYGYIIYDREYSAARDLVITFLENNSINSIGRFGSWRYLSMEESIMDGKIAAESLN